MIIRGDEDNAFPAAGGDELGNRVGFVARIFGVLVEANDGGGWDAATLGKKNGTGATLGAGTL